MTLLLGSRKWGVVSGKSNFKSAVTEETIPFRTWQLLNLLADGEFHSGEDFARQLGVSRASVFNALADVADYGVVLQRIRGRGYRLARPWQRLDRDEILRRLGQDAGKFDVEILPQASSSNTLLLQRAGLDFANGGAPSGSVLAVELQTAGRGRRGRAWHSGLGTALTFSLLWRFDRGLNALSGLSLAVGVAKMRALKKLGAQGVQLKWPNDVLTGHGKLGGVLIEAQGDVLGPSVVVIGIGLNFTLSPHLLEQIDQPVSALDEVCAVMPARNQLLAVLLQELADVLQQFAQDGFSAFREEWEQCHIHSNKPVKLQAPDGSTVSGIARGVSDSGELRLETAQGMRCFNSGEIGVRLRDGGAERSGAGASASHPQPQSGLSANVSGVRLRDGGAERSGAGASASHPQPQSGLSANVPGVRLR
ncbi:MAG: biotin--[acetyl-CoA-carboxylase] ligase [Gallionella sp.]|nr:biotin--[acetyl-CoA-carboxylase] ligase [Gallionella sp.]